MKKRSKRYKKIINSIKDKKIESVEKIIETVKINSNTKPKVIIFNTVKGKGIKEFENDPVWHARQLKGNEISIGKRRLKL